MIVEVYQKV